MHTQDMYTMDYYSAIKKNDTLPFAATWMDLETVTLSEVSQTAKGRYLMTFLKCGIYKEMIQMNLFEKQKQTHRLGERTYGSQRGRMGEGIVREFRINIGILLYLKWITNKDLPYSTWNSAQCSVAAWMGEEFEGEWIHVYVG